MVLAAGRNSPLGGAVDLRVDADGSYVVADGPRAALIRVTTDGSVRSIYRGAPFSIGRRSTNPSATAGVGGPRGVVIDPNGDYIVVDEDSNGLVRITTSGEASAIYSGPPLCQPADVTIFRPPPPAPRPAPQPEVAPEPEAGPTDGAPPTEESGE
jgi:hypothetical protein